ncbi:hypothetical protein HS088_TW19G00606 [Tripterygium wilfordii]|uniref:Uncharacterized protein n=1 Tax=Tripterygium wilfordii TaxID=458696 RepID=A0A7J7CA46_TRIWF|nr:hypothetical protein HS088_TW19G00606 [Tripterygium wilfordii]
MTAMVSALAQVIGSTHRNPDDDQLHAHNTPLALSQSSNTEGDDQSQPVLHQDQGIYNPIIILSMILCDCY